jgi:hypothetical protein
MFSEIEQNEIISTFCSHLRPTLHIGSLPQEIQNKIKEFTLRDCKAFSPTASVIKQYFENKFDLQLEQLKDICNIICKRDTSLRIDGLKNIFKDEEWTRMLFIPLHFRKIEKYIERIYYAIDYNNYLSYAWACRDNVRRRDVANCVKKLISLMLKNNCPCLNEKDKALILKSCELSCNGFWNWKKQERKELIKAKNDEIVENCEFLD